jgi:hypothetical protein
MCFQLINKLALKILCDEKRHRGELLQTSFDDAAIEGINLKRTSDATPLRDANIMRNPAISFSLGLIFTDLRMKIGMNAKNQSVSVMRAA